MAINFEQKKEQGIDSKKILLLVLAIAFAIILYFLFFKGDSNNTNIIPSTNNNPFVPVNIDFTFLSSSKISNLEEFKGIPVLPGFYSASDKQIEPEKIDYGRENPFKEVTKEEIESAILKLILSLEEEVKLEELKQSIINSTLYNSSQKKDFISAIEAKIEDIQEEIKALEEANKEAMEIIINEETEETIEEELETIIEEESIEEEDSNFKVW